MKRRVDGGVMGVERVRIDDSARVVGGFFCVFVGEEVLCLEEAGQAGACHSARPISGSGRSSCPSSIAVVWLGQSRVLWHGCC